MDRDDRTEPPLTGTEEETLLGFLDHHRDTLRLKCAGLDGAQLAQRLEPSTMTLGGMLKHLALVEDWWFSVVLLDREHDPVFRDVDWGADGDWDWRSAVDDPPEQLRALLDRFVAQSQENVRRVLVDGGLDALSRRSTSRRGPYSLRWILLHMVEEYARHNGHADLIRESIDGEVGE